MGVPWGRVIRIVAKIVTALPQILELVENLAERRPDMSSKDKQDAAAHAVQQMLLADPALAALDLDKHPDVDAALRAVVDANVTLLNAVGQTDENLEQPC